MGYGFPMVSVPDEKSARDKWLKSTNPTHATFNCRDQYYVAHEWGLWVDHDPTINATGRLCLCANGESCRNTKARSHNRSRCIQHEPSVGIADDSGVDSRENDGVHEGGPEIAALVMIAQSVAPLTCMVLRTVSRALCAAIAKLANLRFAVVPIGRWKPMHLSFSRKRFTCDCSLPSCSIAQIMDALANLDKGHRDRVQSITYAMNSALTELQPYHSGNSRTCRNPESWHGLFIMIALFAKNIPPSVKELSVELPIISQQWFGLLPQKLQAAQGCASIFEGHWALLNRF